MPRKLKEHKISRTIRIGMDMDDRLVRLSVKTNLPVTAIVSLCLNKSIDQVEKMLTETQK